MKSYLQDKYHTKDINMMEKAFEARIDLQYYTDRVIDDEQLNEVEKYCKGFYTKTKDIISKISEEEIDKIRNEIKNKKNNKKTSKDRKENSK